MTSEVHDTAYHRLRAQDQRYTANRRQIVDLLTSSTNPLSLPELLELANGSLVQSSAYRNLSVLEEAGVVRRLAVGDFARFELAEDLTEHHHHLICDSCHRVTDYRVPADLEASLEHAFVAIAQQTGFRPDHHRLDLIGTCSECGHRPGADTGTGLAPA